MGRRFWALWTATAFSNLGDGMFKFLFPILVARLTTSPSLIAGVSFALTLPWLLFALPVGAIVDRADRRKIMVLVNLQRVIALGCLVAAQISGWLSIELLFAVSFLLGICETFSDTASGSLVPSLVSRDQLEKANARIYSVETIMNSFVGGPTAGLLFSLGLFYALATSSVVFLVPVMALLLLPGHFQAEGKLDKAIWKDIAEGVQYLWNHRLLRTMAGMVAVMASCWSAFFSILVLYAVDPGPMGLNEWQYSFLLTALAAGSVIGSFLVNPIQRRFGRRWLLALDIIGTFIMLAIPVFTHNPIWVGAAIFIAGIGGTTWVVAVNSIRQSFVPDRLLGRVYGAYRLISWGTLPLGALMAGLIAEWISIQAVFIGGALLNLLLIIPFCKVLTNERLQNPELEAARKISFLC